jgi:small conductance mechanosensitive channel
MPPRFRHLLLVAVLLLTAWQPSWSATGESGDAAAKTPDPAQIEALVAKLENPETRDELIASLRLLADAEASREAAAGAEIEAVKTAATELVELAADKVDALTRSGYLLVDTLTALPGLAAEAVRGLGEPQTRARWLSILVNVVIVLGIGFAAAALARLLVRRFRRDAPAATPLPLLQRVGRLALHLLGEVVPIAVFALAAYGTLTVVDPRPEIRLVTIALINASLLTRLVMALSSTAFVPDRPALRLWQLGDETALYIHLWIRRLSFIAIYGFFALQAGALMGLKEGSYLALYRVLGLVVLALLLVLVAQNRHDVARAIAPPKTEGGDEPRQLSSLRRGLARVWHLLAGIYLIGVFTIWVMDLGGGTRFVLQASAVTVAVLAVLKLLLHGTDQLFERGLRLPGDIGQAYPGLETRLNRYFPALRRMVKFALAIVALLLVANAWGIDALGWATGGTGRVLLGGVFNILVIVGVALLVWELASGGIERYLADTDAQGRVRARSARLRTLLTVARNALLVVVTVVATLMVLSEIGINIAPLLAGAGVVGLAIGFGAQRLVQDVINGAFILFQDLMSVGDVVKLGDKAGVVEALSIRTVRLRDLAGVVHTIPFSAIEGVSNLTRDYSFHVFDIGIAYREDVDEVIGLIERIGEELLADAEIGALMLEPLEVFGLDAFGDSAIVIKGRIKTRPIKQWQVGRAFNRLVKKRFDELGIEIPFPHTTVYFGQDKDGSAPPAHLELASVLREVGVEAGRNG